MTLQRVTSRRRFLGAATVAAAGALLAACQQPSSPTPVPPTTAPKPAGAPKPVAAEPTKPAATSAPAPAQAAPATPAAAATTAPAAAGATPTAGPSTIGKGQVELVFSNWNDDTYGRFREEEKIKLFTEQNDRVKVTLRLFRQNYRDTLLTQIAGGQGADVFRLDVPDMYPFADQGTIPDMLPRMMDKDHWYSSSDCKREVFDGLKYRGKLYGLAIGLDSNALEVNGTLFDDAKVPRPPLSYTDKGWNADAVLEAAKKLTKRQGDTPVQFGIDANFDAWQLAPFIWASGGQTLSDDLSTLMWDQEPALKAIQFMADLVNVHKVAPAPSGGDAKTFGYETGKLAMKWSYPSQLTYRYNAKLPWDWTLAPEPMAGAPRTTIDYNLWTMNAKSKSLDQAWAFASFMAGPVAQRVDTELGWAMPAFKSLEEAYYKRILKDYPNKNIKPGLEDLQYTKGWYDPHMQPGWSEAERKYIKPALDEVALGKKTAAQAVREFKPDVDKLLKEGAAKLKG
jgi:multiple sugar transport system substrate-binding protein